MFHNGGNYGPVSSPRLPVPPEERGAVAAGACGRASPATSATRVMCHTTWATSPGQVLGAVLSMQNA